jgi:16S rRNA (cytosine967-C5)-methyltransferase
MDFSPRKTALKVLNELEKGRKTLDRILEDVAAREAFIKRDRALLNTLVYGVLRWRIRLDYIISHFSSTAIKKIDPQILNILRLGLFQIMYLNRIPSSAAVDTSVEMAKSVAAPWTVGFVNALLRKASSDYHSVRFPDLSQNAVLALALKKSFPRWLVARWLDRYGLKTVTELCDAINSIPPITVRTNTLKTSRDRLMQSLNREVSKIEPAPYAPDGLNFFNPKTSISKLDAFQKGWFQVQDEAAQLVSLLLNPMPGETILDACAGLGGKTGHIAQLMNNRGLIVAMDNDAKRLARLGAEMNRLGISIVSPRLHDLDVSINPQKVLKFDRILLDAPCSGLGVLRRNPDIKWVSSKKNLMRHGTRQLRFLDHLASFVKPSGILVYAVCSVEPEENEAVIENFLRKNDEFIVDSDKGILAPEVGRLMDAEGLYKTYPQLTCMDGFFMIRLKRLA